MTTTKLTLTEIQEMSPAATKCLNGTIIVSSMFVLGLLTAQLRRNNVEYKANFSNFSVVILK